MTKRSITPSISLWHLIFLLPLLFYLGFPNLFCITIDVVHIYRLCFLESFFNEYSLIPHNNWPLKEIIHQTSCFKWSELCTGCVLQGYLVKLSDLIGKWPLVYSLCPSPFRSWHSAQWLYTDAISDKKVWKQKGVMQSAHAGLPLSSIPLKSQLECSQMPTFAYFYSPKENSLRCSVLEIVSKAHMPSQQLL